MTIFGNILSWIVLFVILVLSYATAYNKVENITNKVLKIVSGIFWYILVFATYLLFYICIMGISLTLAYDKDELRTPIQSSYVSHKLQSISCGDEFNVFISKNEAGENIIQTVVNNDGNLEIIDLNVNQFNFYFTETENPRIEYYSEIEVEPSMFRWIFKVNDTLHVDLNNINYQYKRTNLKGYVYLPSNMNINQKLIKVCQTH